MIPDPALFSAEAIDPDTSRFVEELRATLADAPDPWNFPAPLLREARERGESIFGMFVTSDRAAERTIPGPEGDVGLRIIEPETDPVGVYLHIHGGGWMLGASHHQDERLVDMADQLGIVTASVEYRLAPEHPYPAGPDDCEAAAVWLVEHARNEFGTDRLIIGGESAGSHLSAVTLLRMRDRHDYTDWVAANLTYGQFDMSGTPSVRNWGSENLVLSTPIIEWFSQAFLGDLNRSDPDISPMFADLSDLPPALFSVGTLDPLLDDSLFMSQRWAAVGNEAELAIYPGGVHAFDYWDEPLGRRSHAKVAEFLGTHLAT
ncbi:MAG TPA: alpha/beta hydrolase [Actinobacteria bacterium]|nr:alpha/beta hydrolase [Actinomycetota bacterium]